VDVYGNNSIPAVVAVASFPGTQKKIGEEHLVSPGSSLERQEQHIAITDLQATVLHGVAYILPM